MCCTFSTCHTVPFEAPGVQPLGASIERTSIVRGEADAAAEPEGVGKPDATWANLDQERAEQR